MHNLPKYIPVWYINNTMTGYYTKSDRQPVKEPFMTLPYELRVETTQFQDIKINAPEIIRGKEKNKTGSFKFFTGLVEVYGSNCFVGNHYRFVKQVKQTDLIFFCFSHDHSRLWVFYFPGYDKNSIHERLKFAGLILPSILNKYTAQEEM